jgi:hypothetical protein
MRAPISIERSLLEIEPHFTSMKWVPREIIAMTVDRDHRRAQRMKTFSARRHSFSDRFSGPLRRCVV